ncbi:MAG: superinfection immunity protein [Oscillospiraceae bacterium]|nr:superinfection immunity protein [Oscillospiraceae bacterium]
MTKKLIIILLFAGFILVPFLLETLDTDINPNSFLVFIVLNAIIGSLGMIVKTVSLTDKLQESHENSNAYGVSTDGHDEKARFKANSVLFICGAIIIYCGIIVLMGSGDIMHAIIFIALGVEFVLFPLYMYPTRVARRFEHEQTTAIAWLNLLFAYTVLGWVLLLVWANSAKAKEIKVSANAPVTQVINTSDADELKKFKDLFDTGVITEEEFNAKKQQLLGL